MPPFGSFSFRPHPSCPDAQQSQIPDNPRRHQRDGTLYSRFSAFRVPRCLLHSDPCPASTFPSLSLFPFPSVRATPRHTTPRHATSRHATPRHATPRHATPRHVTRTLLTKCRLRLKSKTSAKQQHSKVTQMKKTQQQKLKTTNTKATKSTEHN